ncbi:MAG: hypothetical protein J4F98_16415, partial [Acidobacteria bacterium]|nr:hypothetical protein [Acidobacteriota bacterium]
MLAGRLDPRHLAPRRRAAGSRLRSLPQGEILGEASRGQSLPRARQKRQKRAPGGIRTQCPARDVGGNTGAAERILDQGQVRGRLTHQDRDAIEREARGGRAVDAPGDLDALLPLAGGREQVDG